MILINLKFQIKPEHREAWLANVKRYTDAVRGEPGSISFDCYESIERTEEFSIIEGFASKEAGDAHVQTEHFHEFLEFFPDGHCRRPEHHQHRGRRRRLDHHVGVGAQLIPRQSPNVGSN